MYIQKISLQNIRSFESLELDFGDSKAGWHVILGTNGTGKSTLVRSVALALVGEKNAQPLTFRYSWKSWLRTTSESGHIELYLNPNGHTAFLNHNIPVELFFKREVDFVSLNEKSTLGNSVIRVNSFSAAYGSFRRITGGNKDYDNIWQNHSKLAAHLSCFGEDIALDKSIEWLYNLMHWKNIIPQDGSDSNYQEFGLNSIRNIGNFINKSNLLPNNVHTWDWEKATMDLKFVDKNGFKLPLTELSDGYRSILSLTLELIRQLSRFHKNDVESFFVDNGEYLYIKTEGVVLIDEVDSHLHPTWQAQIGDWFTKHFPNIQFIVTTHSPIICRSAVNGTIWKLYNGETSTQITQIIGVEKDQLLYGNILDAYETEVFGENVSRSAASQQKLERLARLNVQKQVGRISEEEEKELKALQQIFQTDAPDNFLAD